VPAAKEGDFAKVQNCLTRGADINLRDKVHSWLSMAFTIRCMPDYIFRDGLLLDRCVLQYFVIFF
jgi:hypothetical protein